MMARQPEVPNVIFPTGIPRKRFFLATETQDADHTAIGAA
jgi:hypothetical protein